jgi:DNA-binding beta-propeller fold protein YncE
VRLDAHDAGEVIAPAVSARYWGASPAPHSGTVALALDDRIAVVAEPDTDTVAVVYLVTQTPAREIALGPRLSPAPEGRWQPAYAPRAVAVAPSRGIAFAACEQSGEVVSIALESPAVARRARVCAGPVSVLVGAGEASVLVSCAADRAVLALDPVSLAVRATHTLSDEPSALALSNEGDRVYVTFPHTDRVAALDAVTLAELDGGFIPSVARGWHRTLAHGVPRVAFDLAARPGSRELWVAHILFATDTAQPELDFESTLFPAVALLDGSALGGAPLRPTLSTDSRLAGVDGAFARVISGPRAVAFLPDGRSALVVGRNSETLTVVDVERGVERQYVEDLPGAIPDGVAVSRDGARAWVHSRHAGTLIPFAIDREGRVRIDGAPLSTRASDPMPAALRAGQHVFYTANDRYIAFPITVNRWIACESCHPEGGTASVTLRFEAGPRDIPDLRQGLDGFLMHTATRRSAWDFWRTINTEQGGQFHPDDEVLAPFLDALSEYVTRAIPPHVSPTVAPARVAAGRAVFERDEVGCVRCHRGERGTDSGSDNPGLDLGGPVRLYDVGTCATDGPWLDRAHRDISGRSRAPCRFDTPTLVGAARSAPYLHDGSAATLRDVLTSRNANGLHGATRHLNPGDLDALVDYLRSR